MRPFLTRTLLSFVLAGLAGASHADADVAGGGQLQMRWSLLRNVVDPHTKHGTALARLTLANLGSKPLPATGPIELQHHGNPIEFKNIYVKELR